MCQTVFTLSETAPPQKKKKIGQSGGLLLLFSHRDVPTIFKNEKIFLCLKIAEIDMGGQFWVEKNKSGHKHSFSSKLNPFFGGKYPNFITLPRFQREILWHHISKSRKATRLKFCIRHAFMAILTYAKFHFNRLW